MRTLSNIEARRLWLSSQGMTRRPINSTKPADTLACIEKLGMVQLDSIGIVTRAHHHIIWSRNNGYRSRMYDTLLKEQRCVFEHYSHDACLLPLSTYPYWQRQLRRQAETFAKVHWGKQIPNASMHRDILQRIKQEGPLCSRDFSGKADKSRHAWMRKPQKLALDYLWLSGKLAVSYRHNFIKYYDLSERIIPATARKQSRSVAEQIDWLCHAAIKRLGFATAGEIQQFWDAVSSKEVQTWLRENESLLMRVQTTDAKGNVYNAWAYQALDEQIASLSKPTNRIRIISPFDPIVRDRNRLERLFGFDYRIEIYTPASKRRFGYYVYPLLEGDRFVGRIELRTNRKQDRLNVPAWWLEPGYSSGTGRQQQLQRELNRLAKHIGVATVDRVPPPSPFPVVR
ncbi:MAG: crosslink repair DNA glycosylase YcaQ family protein [Granulosicoccus sp.]